MHQQITPYGSCVTSLKHMEDLVEHLDRWGVHPDITCTDRLPISEAARAYQLADEGQTGKVCLVFE
jgi:threonine dehydrogenase-like Zn-dependent dehydrogenase